MADKKSEVIGMVAVGDKVSTPDGDGEVTAVNDNKVTVKIGKLSGQFYHNQVALR